MVQTIKRGLKAYMKMRSSFSAYLTRLMLSYRSIPHANRGESPSALMGRQLRSPLTTAFETDMPLWYTTKPGQAAEKARFVVQEGQNTAIVVKGPEEKPTLVHFDQIKAQVLEEEVIVREEPRLEPLSTVSESANLDDQEVPIRRSTRIRKEPDRWRYDN
jgi:hypothetical protein